MTTQPTTTHPETATSDEPQQQRQSMWRLVAGASLISTGLAAYEIVPASVTPLIRDTLHIGPTIAGFLVGIGSVEILRGLQVQPVV
jgi:predicted MFS family arabinose efflux permease